MSEVDGIDRLLDLFPLYSEDLGIDLTEPSGRFKWFLASILFGARISEKIASNTYRSFERSGVDTAERIISAGWDELVKILDNGGYVRYDFSTATKLLNTMADLKERYGSLDGLYGQSSDTKDLERILKQFKGIGAVTAHIFLREMRGIWDVDPGVPNKVKERGGNLDIDLKDVEGERLARIETAIVKLNLRYCKKKRCAKCPMKEYCREAETK
jgi:endonuclease III